MLLNDVVFSTVYCRITVPNLNDWHNPMGHCKYIYESIRISILVLFKIFEFGRGQKAEK